MNLALLCLTILLLLFTLLSLIRLDNWFFRVFDYPRLQKLGVSMVTVVLVLFFYTGNPTLKTAIIAALLLNIGYLGFQIFPFTIFGTKQILKAAAVDDDNSVCIVIANVFQDNKNTAGCLNEIHKYMPDIVLLLETDQHWETGTSTLQNDYPFSVKVPLANTYGMLLYSKFELVDWEVKYLVEENIPSIHAMVRLPSGQKFKLFAVHPTPPVPNENPRSTERDKELLLVADLAKASNCPVIVIGDLNDVAWSYTTSLFLKMSGLLDPRRGRGFFNSFHAHYPFMRFPLDHAFLSTDFKLRNIKRLSNFGSDHFPIYIHVQYEKNADREQESMEVDAADIAAAKEKKEAI
jgi:endonuclease/exonuclease/phosphatase (EEP) superfamily protein YafD